MNYNLVLTAALGALDDKSVKSVSTITDVSPHWLAPGTACEFRIGDPAIVETARAALAGAPIDVNIVPHDRRRKRLLIADMDSTIIGCECIDEIADFAGIKPQIAAITERSMRGEIPFEAALRERVALLKGLPESTLDRVFAERVMLNIGARILVRTMVENGAVAALISGGFTFFTARVAKAAGFSTHQANELRVENGKLSGMVAEPILGREAKREALLRLAREHTIDLQDTLAIGDGANDLAMIGAAGLGIAYRAKPIVAAAARARLDHSDLSAVLYLQGFRETDLVMN
ncbi:MAG: phosphoserine phosphatase SerB [Alphaproteobacteria bacterium]|nr:phosphoserine phosphatase SerB [Alphaproteobacteria bacterium]